MKRNAGFTLVEVLVAIVLLGALVIPVSSGMIMTLRMNEKTEEMMQAQLAVSSAVEELMASGISDTTTAPANVSASWEIAKDDAGNDLPYYNVEVIYINEDNEEVVKVNTTIRKAGG